LAKYCAQRYGVKFQYGVTLKKLLTENGLVTAASTDQGDIAADGFVMALGSYSTLYMRQLGIRLPIYPMKGYSVTIETNEYCPKISLSDGTHKIVYSRVGNHLRVAGTAEFAGYNDRINQKRITPIVEASKRFLPKANWDAPVHTWACLRPQTPDGPPIIGPTPYRNLFINTGHGTLGWTQAAGSASLLGDIMEGKLPAIIMLGLTLRR
jgi:D-amino-acid dehydrogenase